MARYRTTAWLFAVAALLAGPAVLTAAQPPRSCDPIGGDAEGAERRGRRGPAEGWRGGPGPPGMWQVEHLTRRWFMVSPEDRGPLREGELEELLAFARDELPHVYRALERARSRDPEMFRRKFEEHAPPLRHMKRVFEQTPEIGRLVKQHAQNEFQIRRHLRRLWRRSEDSALYADALRNVRALVAENVRIEMRTLTLLKEKFAERISERVDARLAYLLDEGVDLAGERESVREAVAAYRAASPDERDAARQRLAQLAQRRVQRELEVIDERLETLRSHAADEVDRRVEGLLERIKRVERPGPGRGPGPDRGPRAGPDSGGGPGGGRGGDPPVDW